MTQKLVINADDFGRSSPINQGIIEGHQKGIITSASLMTGREGFDEAVRLAKANPRLGIGLHLDLDSFFEAHLRPELFATIAALAAKYKIKVIRYFRGFYEGLYPGVPTEWVRDLVSRCGLTCVDTFFAGWEPVASSLPGYHYLDLDVSFRTAELMVHPGKGEAWREKELAHCLDPHIKDELAKRHIELATFAELL